MIAAVFLLLPLLLRPAESITVNVCNCSRPIVRGSIALDPPSFCVTKSHDIPTTPVHYKFYRKKSSLLEFEAFQCLTWEEIKMITTTALDYPDTTYFHSTKIMNPINCWSTIFPPHDCDGNPMVADGNILKFIQKPIGEYKHWQTVRYSVTNCITARVKIRQETPNGPLLSPLGPLNVSIDNKYAFINQQTLVWTVPPHPPKNCFETDLITQGDGNMTQLDETTGRIIDNTQQLEIIINTTAISTVCDKSLPFYEVKGNGQSVLSYLRCFSVLKIFCVLK